MLFTNLYASLYIQLPCICCVRLIFLFFYFQFHAITCNVIFSLVVVVVVSCLCMWCKQTDAPTHRINEIGNRKKKVKSSTPQVEIEISRGDHKGQVKKPF